MRSIRQGHFVDSVSITHLKNHALKDCKLKDTMVILYFSQTSRLYTINHHEGVVKRDHIKTHTISEKEFVDWGQENQPLLGKLIALLKHVRELAKSNEGSKFVLVGKKGWWTRGQRTEHSINMYERDGVVSGKWVEGEWMEGWCG